MAPAPEPARAERRWVLLAVVAVAMLAFVEAAAGTARTTFSPGPSALERVRTCLTERATPFGAVTDDPVALSAGRGALHTTVEGNGLTIALGSSERDARRVYGDYTEVMSPEAAASLLDLHRRVVFLWERAPTTSQRDFSYLCTLDVQD